MVASLPVPIPQRERRARSRTALLEAAARGLSQRGYGNLVLEQVAAEAGYTRGALYHLFESKEALALAVVEWVGESWQAEVAERVERDAEPLDALVGLARGHVVFCRRDVARVLMALRVEFGDRDHPVGNAATALADRLVARCEALVKAGRRAGTIPPGPSSRTLARAFVGAIEGMTIQFAGPVRDDREIAERIVRGLLGVG